MVNTRVMAVLVVYEREIETTAPWPALRTCLADGQGRASPLEQVLIYDNSSIPRAKPAADIIGCSYVHDACNGGTATAYRCAAAMARAAGIDWLLLLDQDTELPTGYFCAALTALAEGASASPAALVPWVRHGQKVVSPGRLTRAGTILPLQRARLTYRGCAITAVASGSMLNVQAFLDILPMPRELWLDYVDHWIFAELNRHHRAVIIMDQTLEHDLSISTPTTLSRRRLLSILDGEAVFHRLLGTTARLLYPFRVCARLIRYTCTAPRLSYYTLAWVFHRFALSKE